MLCPGLMKASLTPQESKKRSNRQRKLVLRKIILAAVTGLGVNSLELRLDVQHLPRHRTILQYEVSVSNFLVV